MRFIDEGTKAWRCNLSGAYAVWFCPGSAEPVPGSLSPSPPVEELVQNLCAAASVGRGGGQE